MAEIASSVLCALTRTSRELEPFKPFWRFSPRSHPVSMLFMDVFAASSLRALPLEGRFLDFDLRMPWLLRR